MRWIKNVLRWCVGLPPIPPPSAQLGQLSKADVRRILGALEARRGGKAAPDEAKVVEVLKNLDKSAAQVTSGRRRLRQQITERHRQDRQRWLADNAVIEGEDTHDLFKR